jgi:membrane-associated phospholipid phosphatase
VLSDKRMTTFNSGSLTGNKKITPCKVVNRVRHTPPTYWIIYILIALSLFTIFVPFSFWLHFGTILKAHALLTGMLLLFSLVAVSLVWSTGQRIDALVFSFFNTHGRRPLWLDRTMQIVTEFGNGMVTVGIALILYFLVNPHLSYEFIFGTLTIWLIVELIKVLIRRSRPFTKLKDVRVVGARARGKSFPSGHTSQAFYMATLLIEYFHVSIIVASLMYLAALLVGITRMYMGMHYPRDVLAGAILGTCWGLIGITLNSYIF